MTIVFLIGRIIFGLYLLDNARNHFKNAGALAGYAGSMNVPSPKAAVLVSGLLLAVAGLSFITGFMPVIGVIALVLFMVPVSFMMHPFWKMEGDARMMQRIQFTKNMAIVGAGLMLLAIPVPWMYSLGW